MPVDRHPLPLQLRTITVSFVSAARTLTLIGDEASLRGAHDRAQQLVSSLERAGDTERHERLLEVGDTLLAAYRHHLERCAAEPIDRASPGAPEARGS